MSKDSIKPPLVSHPKRHPDCEYCTAAERAIKITSHTDSARHSKFMKYARCFGAIEKWIDDKTIEYNNMDIKGGIEMERAIEGVILLKELKEYIRSAKEIAVS